MKNNVISPPPRMFLFAVSMELLFFGSLSGFATAQARLFQTHDFNLELGLTKLDIVSVVISGPLTESQSILKQTAQHQEPPAMTVLLEPELGPVRGEPGNFEAIFIDGSCQVS